MVCLLGWVRERCVGLAMVQKVDLQIRQHTVLLQEEHDDHELA